MVGRRMERNTQGTTWRREATRRKQRRKSFGHFYMQRSRQVEKEPTKIWGIPILVDTGRRSFFSDKFPIWAVKLGYVIP